MLWRTADDPLVRPEGCRGCHKRCEHNGPVANKEVAKRSKGMVFDCNSVRCLRGINVP